MTEHGLHLFETAIGPCGIAWSERGVAALLLPEADVHATRVRLRRRFPAGREAPPPPEVQRAVDGVVALVGGAASDLSWVPLDLEPVPPFHRRVYDIARTIAPGATLTYGEIAARIGEPGEARAVGQALARNPFPIIVPCHRVLAAGGKIGGFSAPGSITTKRRLLAIEAVHAITAPRLFP